jgi:hypothetical protein
VRSDASLRFHDLSLQIGYGFLRLAARTGGLANRKPSGFQGPNGFNIDFKRRYMFAPFHPNDDLFRIKHDMPRDHSKDLCPQQSQQFRLAAQAAFVC